MASIVDNNNNNHHGLHTKSCDMCYKRKVKCDRVMPNCQHCVARGDECTHTNIFRSFTLSNNKPKSIKSTPPSLISSSPKSEIQNHIPNKQCFVVSFQEAHNSQKNQQQVQKKPTRKPPPLPSKNLFGVLGFVLNNSFIDLKKNVHLFGSGRMEYIGSSPMGLILTMYVVHHSKKNNLDPLVVARKAIPSDNTPPMDIFKGFDFNSLTDHTKIAHDCLTAYFNFFHPFCPLVDQASFVKNISGQLPMLVNLMCAIGQTYLPQVPLTYSEYFTSHAISSLNSTFLANGSLSKVAALLLMGHFQHSPSHFSKSWYYLGLAFRMALSIGLDQPPPPHCSPENVRVRLYLWAWCHILDKGFSYGLSRPWFVSYTCDLDSDPIKSSFTNQFKSISSPDERIRAECSFTYTNQFSVICHILAVILCHFNFTEHIKNEEYSKLEKFASFMNLKLDSWRKVAMRRFDTIEASAPRDLVQVVSSFRHNLDIIYQGTIIQLFQAFGGIADKKLANLYFRKCFDASKCAVKAAYALGPEFAYSGNTYRFYCLSTATLFLLRACQDFTGREKADACHHFHLSMVILRRCQTNFLMAMECHRLIDALAQAEGSIPNLSFPSEC